MNQKTIGSIWAVALCLLLCASQASAGADAVSSTTLIDLNTATADELTDLPRVGVVVAERIIQFREANGRFQKIEEIMNVRGIGTKTFENLRFMITVSLPE